ncbi:peptidoglycan-binding domain-containing protein [Streptomyces sp. Da 82-17]|uniref:peptidoglycan-binding domain-containing protein n=1 Tax=Streptomyces sp. Da 82-17 TaxID=3377116 RepID=UPI0038D47BBA
MSGSSCPGCGTPFLPDFRPACDCAVRAREAAAQTPEPGTSGRVFGQVAPPDAGDTQPTREVLQLFDEVPQQPPYDATELSRTSAPEASGRGWRYGLIAGAAAVVAVTVGVAGGFFSGGDGEVGATGPAESVTVSDSAEPTASSTPRQRDRAARDERRPSSTPTETATEAPTPSATPTTASPTTPSKPPKPTRTSAPATEQEQTPTTLRRGDHGDQVVDLQQRLRQLQLYVGPVNGNYSADVEDAVARFQSARQIPEQPGVYGPQTRAAVERETSQP